MDVGEGLGDGDDGVVDIGEGDGLGVGVPVGVCVGAGEAVGAPVAVCVGAGEAVGAGVGVSVGTGVWVSPSTVGVGVGVVVAVAVGVGVAVAVGIGVGVGVAVAVGVGVGVGDGDAEGDGVGVPTRIVTEAQLGPASRVSIVPSIAALTDAQFWVVPCTFLAWKVSVIVLDWVGSQPVGVWSGGKCGRLVQFRVPSSSPLSAAGFALTKLRKFVS